MVRVRRSEAHGWRCLTSAPRDRRCPCRRRRVRRTTGSAHRNRRYQPGSFPDPVELMTLPPENILTAEKAIGDADHIVVIFSLWPRTMPAMVKALVEQICRNGFAIQNAEGSSWPRQMLKGKSARVVVAMETPSFAFRLMTSAHGVRRLSKCMADIRPVRETLIGGVDALNPATGARLLERFGSLDRALKYAERLSDPTTSDKRQAHRLRARTCRSWACRHGRHECPR